MRPLCFILMPFGTKPSDSGRSIDFDAVYKNLIKPAIEAADLEPIRADEEQGGGLSPSAVCWGRGGTWALTSITTWPA